MVNLSTQQALDLIRSCEASSIIKLSTDKTSSVSTIYPNPEKSFYRPGYVTVGPQNAKKISVWTLDVTPPSRIDYKFISARSPEKL